MGKKFSIWQARFDEQPTDYPQLAEIILRNRSFSPIDQLEYGDYGLQAAYEAMVAAIEGNKRIVLYADYDVDGTMSCVSWIWFFQAIGFTNYRYYIPNRFTEGYGVNLAAIQRLVAEDKAEVIITMDTGITANAEAAWCKENGIQFICTDHHKIQAEKMPDCIILNPKMHPDPIYQELCGCGITFVLLRRLGQRFAVSGSVWFDLLALAGMATICDVVPLNGVNHRLARHGVEALRKSQRPVLKELLEASAVLDGRMDERDIGFRLGPRINAVGRLQHADKVIRAFVDNEPGPLVEYMGRCNDQRKVIQAKIVEEAREQARLYVDQPILFLGGNWHPGVVGIAASKIAEEFWCPVWLFERGDDLCKGSARSIPDFDVTDAMSAVSDLFEKFGGHSAAGGFTFRREHEDEIRKRLEDYAGEIRSQNPDVWQSRIAFDCHLPLDLAQLPLVDCLSDMRPYGHCFDEPRFCIESEILDTRFFRDKQTGKPRHTAVTIRSGATGREERRIMFFNDVCEELGSAHRARFVVTASRNHWRGETSLQFNGSDYEVIE